MKFTPHVDEMVHGKVLEVDLHGKLTREDFERVGPEAERLIEKYGKICILVTMRDFDGWDAGAFWEDLKWEAKHFNDVQRLAIVGEERWQKWMAGFCKPFTTADIRYFPLRSSRKRTSGWVTVMLPLLLRCTAFSLLVAWAMAGAGCANREKDNRPHIYRGGQYYEDAIHR